MHWTSSVAQSTVHTVTSAMHSAEHHKCNAHHREHTLQTESPLCILDCHYIDLWDPRRHIVAQISTKTAQCKNPTLSWTLDLPENIKYPQNITKLNVTQDHRAANFGSFIFGIICFEKGAQFFFVILFGFAWEGNILGVWMGGSGIACDQCDFDHDIIIFLTSNDQIDIVSV